MTKRRRDIFTVIESINNWFEASEHNKILTEDHPGTSSSPESTNAPVTNVPTNGCVAKVLGSVGDAEPWATDNHVSPTGIRAGNEHGAQSKVANGSAIWPQVAIPLAVKTRAGTVPGEIPGGCSDVGSPTDKYNPGNEGAGIGNIPVPGSEAEVGMELALAAFWRLLADAGYDIW